MKLAVVVSEFPKVTETFVLRNVKHYLDQGHEVAVFHLKPYRRHEKVHAFARPVVACAEYEPFVSLRGVAAFGKALVTRPGRLLGTIFRIKRAFWREPVRMLTCLAIVPKSLVFAERCRRRGVEHIHAEFAGYPATAAWIAERMSGIPFSFSCHAHDIFITQSLLREKARDAAFVRVISDFNRRFLTDVFDPDSVGKMQVIRCGVDPATMAAPGPEPVGEGPLRILYVGSLLARKGVDRLIAALAQIGDSLPWECRIIGDGSVRPDLEAQAHEAGLADRITFEGAQPAEVIHEAYQWSHLVVAPSVVGKEGRTEGIPVVLMEALAHARPVITSRVSGIPELVEDGVTGFLTEPGDSDAIAAAIRTIFADWDRAAALGRAGRERIAEQYDVERNAAALLEMIGRHS